MAQQRPIRSCWTSALPVLRLCDLPNRSPTPPDDAGTQGLQLRADFCPFHSMWQATLQENSCHMLATAALSMSRPAVQRAMNASKPATSAGFGSIV